MERSKNQWTRTGICETQWTIETRTEAVHGRRVTRECKVRSPATVYLLFIAVLLPHWVGRSRTWATICVLCVMSLPCTCPDMQPSRVKSPHGFDRVTPPCHALSGQLHNSPIHPQTRLKSREQSRVALGKAIWRSLRACICMCSHQA